MTTKETIHRLVDALPEGLLPEVERFLEQLRQRDDADLPSVFRDAPWDDEPVDPEEAERDREAWEDVRAGRVISNEDLRRELGW